MPGPSLLTLLINSVDRTSIWTPGTFHVNDSLTSRNTADLRIEDFTVNSALRPVVGQTVTVLDTDGSTPLFSGTIDDIEEEYAHATTSSLKYTLRLVDFNQILDRFYVVESFISPTQTLSDIVNFIVTNVLAGEGISTAGVSTGPIIPETKVFNYRTVTQVFNELQMLTNYVWWVDYTKKLNFVARTGTHSGVTLDKSNTYTCRVRTSRGLGPYRNYQLIRAGTAETAVRTEHLTGDGKRKTYNTSFEIERGAVKGNPPAVVLNAVAQTVGLKGIDTGMQFYWVRGSNVLTLDDSIAALSSADDLAVTYIGRYPSVVSAQLDTEIAARKVIEGGTGVYQSLYTDQNLNDLVAQTNLANSFLNRYGFITQQCTMVTDVVGIRSGQLVTLNFPENNVSGDYLVQAVGGSDMQGQFVRYTVTAVNG